MSQLSEKCIEHRGHINNTNKKTGIKKTYVKKKSYPHDHEENSTSHAIAGALIYLLCTRPFVAAGFFLIIGRSGSGLKSPP